MLDTLPSNWFIVVRTGNGPFHLERTNGCTTGVDFCCLLPNRLNANSVTVNQNLHNSFTCVFLRNMTILVPQSIDVLWTHMGIRRNRHNQIQCHFCIRMQSFSTKLDFSKQWNYPIHHSLTLLDGVICEQQFPEICSRLNSINWKIRTYP